MFELSSECFLVVSGGDMFAKAGCPFSYPPLPSFPAPSLSGEPTPKFKGLGAL